jgi:hypothetical protein
MVAYAYADLFSSCAALRYAWLVSGGTECNRTSAFFRGCNADTAPG